MDDEHGPPIGKGVEVTRAGAIAGLVAALILLGSVMAACGADVREESTAEISDAQAEPPVAVPEVTTSRPVSEDAGSGSASVSACSGPAIATDLGVVESAVRGAECHDGWAEAAVCAAPDPTDCVDSTRMMRLENGRWVDVDAILVGCVESHVQAGMPAETALKFSGHSYCATATTESVARRPDCSEAAIYEMLDPKGNGNFSIETLRCDGPRATVTGVSGKGIPQVHTFVWDGGAWVLK